jgi:Fe-S cluster assembly protein SufD
MTCYSLQLCKSPCNCTYRLARLRKQCSSALQTQRMPTTRNEEYRYTDLTQLLRSNLQVCSQSFQQRILTSGCTRTVPALTGTRQQVAEGKSDQAVHQLERQPLKEANSSTAVLIDGVFQPQLSNLTAIPDAVYVGSLANAPAAAAKQLARLSALCGPMYCFAQIASAQNSKRWPTNIPS